MLLFLFLLCCIPSSGQKGLLHNWLILVIQYYLGWPLCLGETLPLRTSNKNLQGQSAVSTRHPTSQHPLEKEVMSSQELRPTRNFLQTHLQEPDFLVHEWCISQETGLVKVLASTSLFYEEVTSKSSTKKGLLYALEESHREYLHVSLQGCSTLTCCHEHKPQEPQRSMALLGHWGWQPLKDMMSLGTDFETHAIWQGYVEEPAAKDFIARKARTIAMSKARGTPWNVIKCEERLGIV